MEKIICVILDESVAFWQVEAIKRIELSEGEVKLFALKSQQSNNDSFLEKIVFTLEKKLLKSSDKFLKKGAVHHLFEQKVNFINDIAEVKSSKEVNYCISFIAMNDSKAFSLSVQLSAPVYQYVFPNDLKNGDLFTGIKEAYKKGANTFEVILRRYFNSKVEDCYFTCNGVEEGLFIYSSNAIAAKCVLILERFLKQGNNNRVHSTIKLFEKKRDSIARTFLKFLIQKVVFKKQWILLYQFNNNKSISDISSFVAYSPPKTKFWADPFPLTYRGTQYVFFEEAELKNNKGYIACCKAENGTLSIPQKVLETPYHLSFPNIFEYNGCIYMIPESAASGAIELWKCTRFPDSWELEVKLIEDIKAVDTVVQYINGKWWLFTTVKPMNFVSGNEELCIYFSENLISNNWIAHTKNPVLSDAHVGRNAGKIALEDGRLYRYSQYSGGGYGKAVSKSEITTINEHAYQEKIVEIVFPDSERGYDNVHSYNIDNELALSDALRKKRRFI